MNSWAPSRCVEKAKRNEQDAASEDHPSITLTTGQRLHIFKADDEWQVWLNTEASDFDGLCVAVGESRDEAIREAVRVFEAAEVVLQGPA